MNSQNNRIENRSVSVTGKAMKRTAELGARYEQLNSDLHMTKETDSVFEIGLRVLVGDAVYKARCRNPYSFLTVIPEAAPARIQPVH
jgi:hypothetical protein